MDFKDVEMLKPKDVAVLFNVTPRTVRLWARAGRIPYLKPGSRSMRFFRSDVEKMLEAR